jgi:hypothetical protein
VPAWIFLISAEAIASTGLSYRIFLVRAISPWTRSAVAWMRCCLCARPLLIFCGAFRWAHLEESLELRQAGMSVL